MKAIIVEIRENHAAALYDDGSIRQLKNKHYTVGQEIEFGTIAKITSKMIIHIASAAAVIILLSASAWAYYTPYSYVSLDVNPSIEYTLNRFDRVLDYTAVNGDGEEILKNLQLKNEDIEEAIKATVAEIAAQGYFPERGAGRYRYCGFKRISGEIRRPSRSASKSGSRYDDREGSGRPGGLSKRRSKRCYAGKSVGRYPRKAKSCSQTAGKRAG